MDARLQQLIKVFGAGLVQSGILKPAAKTAAREIGGAVAKPIKAVQGELLTRAGQAQKFARGGQPFIRTTPVEEAYKVTRPIGQSIADVPAVRIPGRTTPGQMTIGAAPVPEFKTTAAQGPISAEALRLFDTAPGEYKAIQELADRASAYYGKPVTVSDLVAGGAGGGTNLLRTLETDLRKTSALVPSPGGSMRPPAPTSLVGAPQQGGGLVSSPRGALIEEIIRRGQGTNNMIDVDVREIANGVGGLRQLDLGKLGLAAGLIGTGAAGFGFGRMSAPSAPAVSEQPSPMGPTTANPESGPVNDPQVAQQEQRTIAQTVAAGMAPSARAVIPQAAYTGAGGQPVMVTRGQDEALTAAMQQYAKPQDALKNYYSKREDYANFPAYKTEIISELQKRGVLDTPELVTWAGANPTLAYELLRKATGSNVLPSQQVPQPTQMTITAPMGSNNANNSVGNSISLGEGAVDLYNATQPSANLEINPIPTDIIGRLQQSVLLGR